MKGEHKLIIIKTNLNIFYISKVLLQYFKKIQQIFPIINYDLFH